MKIVFSTDSTCDLPSHYIQEKNIAVLPLIVTLGTDEFYDGVNVQPDQLYDYFARTKEVPKTAGRGIEDFKEFFSELLEKYDMVIHCGIGAEMSVCYNNANMAAKELGCEDKIKIVDSSALSASTGLVILSGIKAYEEGATVEEILSNMRHTAKNLQTSFVPDKLDYIYRSGRCSRFSFSMASLLKIKPRLEVVNGKLINTGKEIGPFKNVIIKYIDTILKKYDHPRRDLAFLVHSKVDENLLQYVLDYVESKGIFDRVETSLAGSVISSHCGDGTIGLLYVNDGEKLEN